MGPHAGRQRRGAELLLAAAAVDREAQRAAARPWRKEQVVARVITKIENALPVRSAVPVNPTREAPVGAVCQARRELEIIGGAIERDGLAELARGERRRAHAHRVLSVAPGIMRVAIERISRR